MILMIRLRLLNSNKIKVLVPVIGINKSKRDIDLKVENTIIEANNKLNKNFKNSYLTTKIFASSSDYFYQMHYRSFL
jgi:translation initiation factor 2 alpha subunit (eIF-2alpha)